MVTKSTESKKSTAKNVKTAKATADKPAKKSVASSAKAVVKAVSAKENKVVREAIKDTHMGGFVNFIREQGIVGLAVGSNGFVPIIVQTCPGWINASKFV